MTNQLRELYKARTPAVGTFFNMGDMSSMECLGYTGLDFVIIDTEHGPFDTETMMDLIRAAESVRLTPVVRIADVTHREIQRAADCGAQGLIVPCLREVDEYRKLVDLGKYPPLGNRGFIKGRGCGFGNQPWAAGSLEDYMASSDEKLMLIPQCETVESLQHIEEIAALPGIDAIFIGPFDLSISMGIPGRFQLPEFPAGGAADYRRLPQPGQARLHLRQQPRRDPRPPGRRHRRRGQQPQLRGHGGGIPKHRRSNPRVSPAASPHFGSSPKRRLSG